MPEPTFFSWGSTPHRTDTKWTEAVRWLGSLQNQSGADSANNPRRRDSFNRVLKKIAAALENN